jgi:hypothetical protein
MATERQPLARHQGQLLAAAQIGALSLWQELEGTQPELKLMALFGLGDAMALADSETEQRQTVHRQERSQAAAQIGVLFLLVKILQQQ